MTPRGLAAACVFACGLVSSGVVSGCTPQICSGPDCGAGGASTATTTSSSASTSSTSTTMATTTSSMTGVCERANLAGGAIAPECGVFVVPGATGGDGSQAMPFGSVADALARGGKEPGRIYVCATNGALEEAVVLTAGYVLQGGFGCKAWTLSDKTAWSAPVGSTPLALSEANGARIEGFSIASRDAVGVGPAGETASSFAVVSIGSIATFIDVDILAGKGANGASGMDQVASAPGATTDPDAFNGNAGAGCGLPPAAPKSFPCSGGNTIGGAGGSGNLSGGDPGGDGTPNLGGGQGGDGDTGIGSWTCFANNGKGGAGNAGGIGSGGMGATGLGTLSPDDASPWIVSYMAPVASAGFAGGRGQGGGGGGGRRGDGFNGCSVGVTGPSGSSGGAGGCGGAAGAAGGSGGASIGVVSLYSMLGLTRVHVTTSAGGSGGNGGGGQLGGAGGAGGMGGGPMSSCAGGKGGDGGNGGGGGGGKGGPSVGIAFLGEPPVADASSEITIPAMAAPFGVGGGGTAPGAPGAAGELADTLEVSPP